jgi:uncharacterized protein (DUF433 family)
MRSAYKFIPTPLQIESNESEGNIMNKPLVIIDPEIQSGEPVFVDTRVRIKNLFDYLQAFDSPDVFLDQFPSVSRELAVAVLQQARALVSAETC